MQLHTFANLNSVVYKILKPSKIHKPKNAVTNFHRPENAVTNFGKPKNAVTNFCKPKIAVTNFCKPRKCNYELTFANLKHAVYKLLRI